MRRFSYADLDREDRGVDHDYLRFRNLRRMMVAAVLLNLPLWGVIVYCVIHIIRKAGH